MPFPRLRPEGFKIHTLSAGTHTVQYHFCTGKLTVCQEHARSWLELLRRYESFNMDWQQLHPQVTEDHHHGQIFAVKQARACQFSCCVHMDAWHQGQILDHMHTSCCIVTRKGLFQALQVEGTCTQIPTLGAEEQTSDLFPRFFFSFYVALGWHCFMLFVHSPHGLQGLGA